MAVALLLSCAAITPAQADRLLPFQGHLTDSSGVMVADGVKVVQFKIYDAPVSGNAVWAGEVHKLSVNRGLVNTILGTKAAFPERYGAEDGITMFSEPLYLEITVDADNSGSIGPSDPPLLPRQVMLPANFAIEASHALEADTADFADVAGTSRNSEQLAGMGWSDVLIGGDPSNSFLRSDRIQDASISPEKLVKNLLIPVGTIFSSLLAPELFAQSVGDSPEFNSSKNFWVLADGQLDIANSTYGQLVGATIAPDLRGVFLRGMNQGRDDGYADPESERQVGSLQADAFSSHSHRTRIHYNENDGNNWALTHGPEANGPHAAASTEVGGDETRPNNAAVYYYLKIN